MLKILRLWFTLFALAMGMLTSSTSALAQTYPTRPIRLIVPYAPGGIADFMARRLAEKLGVQLGQQVTVENRPGAGGTIGFTLAAKSPPDGYTMVLGDIKTLSLNVNNTMVSSPAIDIQRDFLPVSLLAQVPTVLLVDSSLAATSVQQLLHYVAASPTPITYGSTSASSVTYLAAMQFKTVTGAPIEYVPFREAESTLAAVTSQQVQIAFVPLTNATSITQTGKTRSLAITGDKRSSAAPDVPTFAEIGIKNVDAASQYAVLLPSGTSRGIVKRLNEELVKIVQSSAFQNEMTKLGVETVGSTPEELVTIISESHSIAKYAHIAKEEDEYEYKKKERPPPSPAPLKASSYKVVKVSFGTDRKLTPNPKSPSDFFSDERGQGISYGTCDVSIPRQHKTGELEAPFVLRKYFENPEKHVVLMRIDLRKQNEFFNDLGVTIAEGKTSTALIFVHGYNNSFEDAARRTAQIAHDIEFTGIPMFYSWPSGGKALSYISDGNDADQAVFHLKQFLKDVALNSGFTSITLLAHSMGNRALTRAFMALKNEIDGERLRVFKEIILAAPDIDADVFKNEIAPALLVSTATVTLYASSNDEALIASKKLNGAPRAGDSGSGLVIMKGMETIDATNVDTNLFWGLRHAYVADNWNVLSDLSYLIVKGLRAPSRYGLEPIPSRENPQYWRFKR